MKAVKRTQIEPVASLISNLEDVSGSNKYKKLSNSVIGIMRVTEYIDSTQELSVEINGNINTSIVIFVK